MKYQEQFIETIFNSALVQKNSALEIYHNNYLENGIRSLSISFPSVHAVLDEQDFRKLCKDYLQKFPKTCFDWADYGSNFSDFILSMDVFSSLPFLPEIAKFDYIVMQAERQSDSTFQAESFSFLQSEDSNNLCFELSPALQIERFIFPVIELRTLLLDEAYSYDSDEKKSFVEKINKSINDAIKQGHARSIVVWRADFKAEYEYVQENSLQALKSMLNHDSIAIVLSHFDVDQQAMTLWLQTAIQSKKIYGVKVVKQST